MIEKNTKIICTIADNRCDEEFIRQLYENGMNVVRINSAHASVEGAQEIVDNVRKVSDKIAILIDTKGPEVRLTQILEVIKDLIDDCFKSLVAGISFGGQMHGLVILDENDEVIRPAILWNDGRTVKETDYLNQVIGKETLSKYTANIAFAGFTAPKILCI